MLGRVGCFLFNTVCDRVCDKRELSITNFVLENISVVRLCCGINNVNVLFTLFEFHIIYCLRYINYIPVQVLTQDSSVRLE